MRLLQAVSFNTTRTSYGVWSLHTLYRLSKKMSPEEREFILSRPAAPPPPGKKANFEHPSEFDTVGLVVAIVLLVIIAILFSIRMFVKARIARHVALEDCKCLHHVQTFINSLPCMQRSFSSCVGNLHCWLYGCCCSGREKTCRGAYMEPDRATVDRLPEGMSIVNCIWLLF
jgi:hypothetical protein